MTAAIFNRDPFDKLISLSVLIAGIFPFIVDRGFLDVAIALALIAPLSTIFILMVCQGRVTVMIAGLYPRNSLSALSCLFAGTIAVAFPRPKNYLTRLINLEIPGCGLLLIMLSL